MSVLQWIKGNAKLQKTSGGEFGRVVGFGIPADYDFAIDGRNFNTCPAALACRGVCYAKQGAYLWASTVAARKRALDQTLRESFATDAIADLQAMRGVGVVRIHDSGDFYSQEYLDAWCDIARALPSIIFYAYTKSLHLSFDGAPPNLRITQSMGGKHDNLVQLGRPHSRIFATDDDRITAGYVDGNESDAPAIKGLVQIGLVYHGNKKLTDAQTRFFGA